jgi:hypothetical protein
MRPQTGAQSLGAEGESFVVERLREANEESETQTQTQTQLASAKEAARIKDEPRQRQGRPRRCDPGV